MTEESKQRIRKALERFLGRPSLRKAVKERLGLDINPGRFEESDIRNLTLGRQED